MAQVEEGERARCGANSGQGFCSSLQGFPALECSPALHLLRWAPPATNQIVKLCLQKGQSYLQLNLSQVPALGLLHPCQVPLVLPSRFPSRVGQGEVEQRHFRLAVLCLCVLVRLRGLLCFWGNLRKIGLHEKSYTDANDRFSKEFSTKLQNKSCLPCL